jgi:hypothetical protein
MFFDHGADLARVSRAPALIALPLAPLYLLSTLQWASSSRACVRAAVDDKPNEDTCLMVP